MGAAGVHRAAALAAAGVILMASGRPMLGGCLRVSGGGVCCVCVSFRGVAPRAPSARGSGSGYNDGVFITSRRCVKCRDLCETKGNSESMQPNHTTVFDIKGYMHFARVLP